MWPRRVRCQRCRRRIAEGAPHPFERASFGVEHDNALVAIAVGGVHLFRGSIDEHVRCLTHVLRIQVPPALSAVPDLHDELSSHREFQNHVVADAGSGLSRPARAPSDPYKVVRVHEDAVLASRPYRPCAWPAPTGQQFSRRIELEYRRRGVGTLRLRNRLRHV